MAFTFTRRRRAGAAVALVGAAALVFAGCTSDPAPTEPAETEAGSTVDPFAPETADVSFTSWRTTATAPFYIAEMDGFFEEYGIAPTVEFAENSPASIAAVIGGTTDIGNASLWAVMSAINEGIDLRIIGESFRHVENSMFVMTLPGSGIEDIEDLAGHKIGVTGLNAGHDLMIKNYYIENGLDVASVEFVSLGYGEMGQALQTGAIDAGAFTGPPLEQAIAEIGAVEVFDFIEQFPQFPATSYIVRGEWADENPNTVAAFQCAVAVRGAEIAREGGEAYEQPYIDAMAYGLDWDEAATVGSTKINHVTLNDPEWQQIIPDLMFQNDLIASEIAVADIVVPLPDNC
jgi:NitT/TauT family transport system substrate-binding protein